MYLKFRTNAPVPYMEYVLTKLDLEIQLLHNEKYDFYSTWVEGWNVKVDRAVSCWLQVKLRDSGFEVEPVELNEFEKDLGEFSCMAEAENNLYKILAENQQIIF